MGRHELPPRQQTGILVFDQQEEWQTDSQLHRCITETQVSQNDAHLSSCDTWTSSVLFYFVLFHPFIKIKIADPDLLHRFHNLLLAAGPQFETGLESGSSQTSSCLRTPWEAFYKVDSHPFLSRVVL